MVFRVMSRVDQILPYAACIVMRGSPSTFPSEMNLAARGMLARRGCKRTGSVCEPLRGDDEEEY
jgi:hypothetical protein